MRLLLLYVAFTNVLSTPVTSAEENLMTEAPRAEAAVLHDLGEIKVLPDDVIEKVKEKCKDGHCLVQDEKAIEMKKFLRDELIAQQKEYNGTVDIAAIDRRFQKTFQLKQEILNKQGIGHLVAAADNGLFDGDIFLKEDQADEMLRKLNNPLSSKAGLALFLDNPDKEKYKWDVKKPIKFTYGIVGDKDKAVIDSAFAHLTEKVPCIRFEHVLLESLLWNTAYLKLYGGASTSTACGVAPFGRESEVGPTSVYTYTTSKPECNLHRGNFLHFIMHALGVLHMQQRYDRDKYISVNAGEIKDEAIEAFRILNDTKQYSTYGTTYDIHSVMHSRIIEKQWGSDNLFRPINQGNIYWDNIGRSDNLSGQDIRLLNEMYCLNPKCANEVDLKVCQTLFKRGKCNVAIVKKWCRRTCNLC